MSQPPHEYRQKPGWSADDPGRYQQHQGPTATFTPAPEPPRPDHQPAAPQGPGRSHRGQQSWPGRHKILSGIIAASALLVAASIGATAGKGTSGSATPAPTVTVTRAASAAPAVTVTATATVAATANAQGEATQISADGVYVIGQDIPGGTWHTSGGSQCYEATLASTDTSNIIDNNNFTGPDTVSLAGAKAFNISGGCTWQQGG